MRDNTYQNKLADAQRDLKDAVKEHGQDSEEAYWAFKREREVRAFG